jgi:hypothetical protein
MKYSILILLFPLILVENFTNRAIFVSLENQELHLKKDVKTIGEKYGPVNINEVLWFRVKYKIEKMYPHCLMSSAEMSAIAAQNQSLTLKYGNGFWERVAHEIDSIEKNNLGYKKTQLLDLEKYLNQYDYKIAITPFPDKKPMFVFTNFKIDSNGKLLNIELEVEGSLRNFGKEKSEIKAHLLNILEKAPFIRPSTFLNEGIDDRTQILITSLK